MVVEEPVPGGTWMVERTRRAVWWEFGGRETGTSLQNWYISPPVACANSLAQIIFLIECSCVSDLSATF